jgi:hypothetical protein
MKLLLRQVKSTCGARFLVPMLFEEVLDAEHYDGVLMHPFTLLEVDERDSCFQQDGPTTIMAFL